MGAGGLALLVVSLRVPGVQTGPGHHHLVLAPEGMPSSHFTEGRPESRSFATQASWLSQRIAMTQTCLAAKMPFVGRP